MHIYARDCENAAKKLKTICSKKAKLVFDALAKIGQGAISDILRQMREDNPGMKLETSSTSVLVRKMKAQGALVGMPLPLDAPRAPGHSRSAVYYKVDTNAMAIFSTAIDAVKAIRTMACPRSNAILNLFLAKPKSTELSPSEICPMLRAEHGEFLNELHIIHLDVKTLLTRGILKRQPKRGLLVYYSLNWDRVETLYSIINQLNSSLYGIGEY